MDGGRWARVLLAFVAVASAGCAGALGGAGGTLSFAADPVSVEPSAVEGSGYAVAAEETFAFEEPITVAEQTRTVEVTAGMVHLRGDGPRGPLAQIAILSVPDVEVLGQRVALAERVGPLSLVERAVGSVETVERDRKLREHRRPILGAERTIEVYAGTAAGDGGEASVEIYLASFGDGGDTIVAAGVTPRTEDRNGSGVLDVFEGIERP